MPNHRSSADAASTVSFHAGHQWRCPADSGRSAAHMMKRHYSFLLLTAVLFAGCVDPMRVPYVPPRTKAEADVIVTNLVRQKGVPLEDYQQPRMEFDAARRQWSFLYVLKPPGYPGGHFMVTVDKKGKAELLGGM